MRLIGVLILVIIDDKDNSNFKILRKNNII